MMKKLKPLCALALALCLLLGGAQASVLGLDGVLSTYLDINGDVRFSLGMEIKTLMPFGEETVHMLNGILKHVKVNASIQGGEGETISALQLGVDGQSVLDMTETQGAGGTALQTSLLKNRTLTSVGSAMDRLSGNKAGVEALREIIKYSDELGVEALTIYAFSTENWKRSTEEVGALMRLLLQYFTSEIDELNEKNVRIRILGDIDGMPRGLEKQKDALHAAIRRTHENTGLQLNIALNYGGQQEIVRAAQKLAERVAAGAMKPEEIDRAAFEGELYTAGLPDVDLLIRTSGEMRLSNFLLYQLAYAEFYQTDTLWPDFDRHAYDEALLAFAKRNRRFGGV